eukprot:2036748-Rhodomonas_salina.1
MILIRELQLLARRVLAQYECSSVPLLPHRALAQYWSLHTSAQYWSLHTSCWTRCAVSVPLHMLSQYTERRTKRYGGTTRVGR